jgi:hypothetical protein
VPHSPLPEIQVVIVIFAPAITSALAFISPILSLAESTPPVSPLDISFPAIPIDPVILSRRLRYRRDRHPRPLYQRLS